MAGHRFNVGDKVRFGEVYVIPDGLADEGAVRIQNEIRCFAEAKQIFEVIHREWSFAHGKFIYRLKGPDFMVFDDELMSANEMFDSDLFEV